RPLPAPRPARVLGGPRPPRCTPPPQSPSRTAAGPHAAPPLAGLASATRLAPTDPHAVSACPYQTPPSRCCDDPLNPRAPCPPVCIRGRPRLRDPAGSEMLFQYARLHLIPVRQGCRGSSPSR